MDATWQMVGAGGPWAWALVAAGTLAAVTGIVAVASRRWRKVASRLAIFLAISTVGIGARPHLSASSGDDAAARLADAVQAVHSGDVEGGCAALDQGLTADPALQRLVDGAAGAVASCVDHRIEEALAVAEPLARERALLSIASADAVLTPTREQFQRIAREAADVPGAENEGGGRVRIRSYEIRGPLPTRPLRAHARDQLIRLRGCHARAWQEGRGVDGEIELKVFVEEEGRITRVAADGLEARFHTCVEAAFVGAQLGAIDAPSRATIAIDLDPA